MIVREPLFPSWQATASCYIIFRYLPDCSHFAMSFPNDHTIHISFIQKKSKFLFTFRWKIWLVIVFDRDLPYNSEETFIYRCYLKVQWGEVQCNLSIFKQYLNGWTYFFNFPYRMCVIPGPTVVAPFAMAGSVSVTLHPTRSVKNRRPMGPIGVFNNRPDIACTRARVV